MRTPAAQPGDLSRHRVAGSLALQNKFRPRTSGPMRIGASRGGPSCAVIEVSLSAGLKRSADPLCQAGPMRARVPTIAMPAGPAMPAPIQRQARIGPADDALEREADRIADSVMAGRATGPITPADQGIGQRRCAECDSDERQKLQRKTSDVGPGSAPSVNKAVTAVSRGGNPLSPEQLAYFEPRFGRDLSQVRLHTDGAATSAAREINAHAFTFGNHVAFADRLDAEGRPESQALLAHELVHTVQQGGQAHHLQRRCNPTECPPAPIALPAQWPLWRWAEECIQNLYADAHPDSRRFVSLSFNDDWRNLTGGPETERLCLGCVRNEDIPEGGPHFTARGGLHGGEPDIWDFHNQKIYEITTPWGEAERVARVAAEAIEATQLCAPMTCGGLQFGIGTWSPLGECYTLPGPLRLHVLRNNAGVIVYRIEVSARDVAALATVVSTAWLARYAPAIARGLAQGAPALEAAAAQTALRESLAVSTTTGATGGTTAATAGAVETTAAAEVATGEVALTGLGAGAGAIAAGAVPVLAMVGVFVALGAGYAEARAAAKNEGTASGFSQGFVMGTLGWEWHQAVDRFGKFSANQTPMDEAVGFIAANAYNWGLRKGHQAGAALSLEEKRSYLHALRRWSGSRAPRRWTRLEQIDYVIDLAAALRLHLMREE